MPKANIKLKTNGDESNDWHWMPVLANNDYYNLLNKYGFKLLTTGEYANVLGSDKWTADDTQYNGALLPFYLNRIGNTMTSDGKIMNSGMRVLYLTRTPKVASDGTPRTTLYGLSIYYSVPSSASIYYSNGFSLRCLTQ